MASRDRKRWTVLIYMVADDPQGGELLDGQAVREMDQITTAAMSVSNKDDLYVAVQVDFRTLPGVWRRVIGESTFVRPESNAAHPATLYGFFEWAAKECPADHYLLIFWGHSRAQFGMFGDSDPWEYTAQTLTLDELGDALKAAKRSLGNAVDIVAFKDCFMATLETAYQLSGLADYLLASPALVPVERWPYDDMFKALVGDDARSVANKMLEALRKHYDVKENRARFDAVPYSLLSTRAADAVVKQLALLVGDGSGKLNGKDENALRQDLTDAATTTEGGDPALVDLNTLLARQDQKRQTGSQAAERSATPNPGPGVQAINQLVVKQTLTPQPGAKGQAAQTFAGVGVFVYPSTPKGQRESRLTRLADEKAYRRLAISTDTKNWADIAWQSMPPQPARKVPDVAAAIAVFEQMQRLGLGMAPGAAAASNGYLQRLARRNGDLTDGELAQAAEFAAISELAARLAAFAGKGADGFGGKGADGFNDIGKGADGFGGKGADGFVDNDKGADGFVGGT